ncbi:MAG TPA: hypothetical protein PLJ42_08050 [Chitinophagales bacterium]|jgi:hypothetical protein|nr:hypothetical protein [Chitinophagales bacterium]MBP6153742.1 hypothetical protein [Chitinophagales bacterium]HQV78175.1 hypothetical protein [Chitinophagales bacterium]HQW79372.1 hypothetical protein [Chitinophagales bacterium]HRB18650.1 hypothetical protein [Chitinophagales bacterium]
MKSVHKLIFFILFWVGTHVAYAQFVPGIPTVISTPYGNIPIPTYYHMPIAYWNTGNKSTTLITKDYYLVKLKNDSTLKIYGEIDLSNDKHSLLIKEKKAIIRKIYPDETRYILALGEKNLKTKGEPNDSCWVFKQLNDSISLYSVVPIAGTEYSIYFSKSGNTELIALNEKNLLPIVGDDEELKKLITHKSYIKAIKKYNNKLREKNN